MKTAIIALSLVLSALSAAHAGTVVALSCPQSGSVVVDTGNGENELTITHNEKHYTVTERTERYTDHGQIVTIQGASMADNPDDWRAVAVPSNFSQTGVMMFIRSDVKPRKEVCHVTDIQNYN